MEQRMKIIGSGIYTPTKIMTSEEWDEKLGLPKGWTYDKSGVKTRFFVDGETASQMGAKAALKAVEKAGITLNDIDCIVSGS